MLLEEGLWAIRMAGMVEVVLRGAPDPVSCAGRGHPKCQEGARRPLDRVLEGAHFLEALLRAHLGTCLLLPHNGVLVSLFPHLGCLNFPCPVHA